MLLVDVRAADLRFEGMVATAAASRVHVVEWQAAVDPNPVDARVYQSSRMNMWKRALCLTGCSGMAKTLKCTPVDCLFSRNAQQLRHLRTSKANLR